MWRGELPLRARRFIRFALGSAAATLASAAALYVVFHAGAPAAVASVTAFLAGFVVNFVAARFWAWSRRGQAGLGRDVVSYLVVAVSTALAATAVTTLTDHYARRTPVLDAHLTIVVEAAYFSTYAAVFLVKFTLLDRVVFRSGPGVDGTTGT